MMFYLEIRQHNRTAFAGQCDGSVEIGRQQPPGAEGLWTLQQVGEHRQRLAIVPVSETKIGRWRAAG